MGNSRFSSWLAGRGSVDDVSPIIVPRRITARGRPPELVGGTGADGRQRVGRGADQRRHPHCLGFWGRPSLIGPTDQLAVLGAALCKPSYQHIWRYRGL